MYTLSLQYNKQNYQWNLHRWFKDVLIGQMKNINLRTQTTSFPDSSGSTYSDLRKISGKKLLPKQELMEMQLVDFPWEPEEEMYRITNEVTDILPKEKPRYLMGVGTPWNIIESIGLGIDMMDCVMPTRNARNAMLFYLARRNEYENKKMEKDFSP